MFTRVIDDHPGLGAAVPGMSSQTSQADRPNLLLVEPKLMLPRVQPRMLRRARLLELLDGDDAAALTLINAPVGYGKTTFLRLWCIERPEAVIWMTLDAADDDPVRLWTHLATAIERLGEGLGSQALMRLGVRGAGIEAAVDEVMNGLVAYGRPVAIVLDDLHTVGSERSLRSIAHAIERLPTNARLLAATGSEPAIRLARLRARGGLIEIRARELAFTLDETHELMVREGIALSDESVELLVEHTEGWPAGLYLAALWLRDHEDPDQGVRAFAGSSRQVADYLTDAVLSHAHGARPGTSWCAPRCWSGSHPSCATRSSAATTRLRCWRSSSARTCSWSPWTAREQWYRYHHLFGELLQLELGREDAAALRRRAAVWCRAHGFVEDAIEYAAAAGDAETVAGLLVENDRAFVWGGRLIQFLGWVRGLSSELLLEQPSLPAGGAVAAALLARPEVEVQRMLAVAERARRERPQLWSPYAEAIVEVTRAAVIEHGDVGAAVEHARRARAAARAGADVLSVGVLASPRAGAVLCRRSGRVAADRHAGHRAARRAGRPRGLCRKSRAARAPRRRARANRERGGVGSSGDRLRTHAIPSGFLDGVAGPPWACAGVRRERTPR